MSPTLAVDLAPADVASPYAQALLESCTLGMQSRARCVLGEETRGEDQGVAVAIVTWDGAARTGAHVEVGRRTGRQQGWRARDLSFSSTDTEIERWRTVGFAIATVASDRLARDDDASRPEPTPPESASRQERTPLAPVPEDAREAPPAPAASWLDVLLSVETGAGTPPAVGGQARYAHMLDPERVFVTAAAACTIQSLDPAHLSIVRLGVSTGAGLAVRLGARWRFTLRGGASLELAQVTGTDALTGTSAQGVRGRLGLEQGIDGSWMPFPSVGVVAGMQLLEASGGVDILAHGHRLARLPAFDGVGQAGVRIAFP